MKTSRGKTHRWKDVEKELFTPKQQAEARRWAEQEILELNLRSLREMVGKTQVDLADASEMAQSEVSKVERRGDHMLSTLRRYVEALGGELEVRAVFNGGQKTVKLTGV